MLLLVAPGNIPRLTDQDGALEAIPLLDWRVAAFSAAVAAFTGILFGLFPALHISNPDLASTLKKAAAPGPACFTIARARCWSLRKSRWPWSC